MTDAVLAELWRIKDEIAAEAGRDIRSLLTKLRVAQASSTHRTVNLARERARRKRSGAAER